MPDKFPIFAQVIVPEYIEPFDRGDRYDDPLETALEESELGEIVAVGSHLNEDRVIDYVYFELALANNREAIDIVVSTLEKCGAPKGCTLTIEPDDQKITFGITEGVAFCLDGVGLPPDIYERYDINTMWDQLDAILQEFRLGELHGSKQFDETTELYLYGPSANQIIEKTAEFRSTFPLCRNSKVRKLP